VTLSPLAAPKDAPVNSLGIPLHIIGRPLEMNRRYVRAYGLSPGGDLENPRWRRFLIGTIASNPFRTVAITPDNIEAYYYGPDAIEAALDWLGRRPRFSIVLFERNESMSRTLVGELTGDEITDVGFGRWFWSKDRAQKEADNIMRAHPHLDLEVVDRPPISVHSSEMRLETVTVLV
jgi:hypothetical protein